MNTLLDPPITGAPYITNDPITVEVNGTWREAIVVGVERITGPGRFGLVWRLRVRLDTESSRTITNVVCDDNGRNHTWRQQVCPSSLVST